jgi:purine-binding chemotaxis protein CheW
MENRNDSIDMREKLDTNEMKGKYLTFWTDNQLFGVPICDVVQIIGNQEITSIPDSPRYAKGVINLRGNIIPVIDVRLRFGKEETAYDEKTCIIVSKIEENYIGFIVDSVDEVTTIEDTEISPPPKMSKDRTNAYLTGIGKIENKVVMLLDTSKILNHNEFELVNSTVMNEHQ